jgi:deazaflavin-dependent oxidoreductase (nitroreductase family)
MGKAVGLVAGVMLAAAGTWFLGMRTGWRPVVDLQRRINRDLLNPRMVDRSPDAGGPSAIIHHTGRRSGTPYRTPVGAARTEDGFVVATVYGPGSDWIRNVLAEGPARVEAAGGVHEVVDAELVGLDDVAGYFTPAEQRAHRVFGVRQAVRLRTAAAD